MKLNKEKQEIVKTNGNILVTANPGTGKTLLLAHKYAKLIENGISAEEILCLTFTRKAKREMESRIIKILEEKEIKTNLSKLNIHTFHSYALECLNEQDIISPNLIRYAIYEYVKENEIFNYSDDYIIGTLVPKIENLMRYVKNFGILPQDINSEKAKKHLKGEKMSIPDLENFFDHFINIYEFYEEKKSGKGHDYSDILIEYLKLDNKKIFKYVLVDELQDVNEMEAQMALESGENFIAVGDPKQAIFGFQGGSILNFKKFKNSKQFTLSENFRSTDQILDYAKNMFIKNTEEKRYEKALRTLRSSVGKKGDLPKIISAGENPIITACSLAQEIHEKGEEVAIVGRTNAQISKISNELKERGLEHSSTHFSASNKASESIIKFVRAVLGSNVETIKAAMFTPFFPISMQDAFEIAERKEVTLNEIYKKSPEFRNIRKNLGSIEDVSKLFEERIIPVAVGFGEAYFLASLELKKSFEESNKVLGAGSLNQITDYLKSADLAGSGSSKEDGIIVTTVHKAKGKEFKNVIYLPERSRDRTNFVDEVVEAILLSKGINVAEELEEEDLRIDFVAFTRAEEMLYIISERPGEYISKKSVLAEPNESETEAKMFSERKKRAYSLFVNKEFDKAKSLLEKKDTWLREFVENHFKNKERISYSNFTTDAYTYLKNTIFSIREPSYALSLGNKVHKAAEDIINGEKPKVDNETKLYVKNIRELLKEIKATHPEIVSAEEYFKVDGSEIFGSGELLFSGLIDAVFKNKEGEYLLVDWKTSKRDNYSSQHRRQLELYKRAYSVMHKIPLEKIRVAIAYVGLRKRINDGTIRAKLDDKQPTKTSFATAKKRWDTFLKWKNDINTFFEDLAKSQEDNHLLRSIVEEYERIN